MIIISESTSENKFPELTTLDPSVNTIFIKAKDILSLFNVLVKFEVIGFRPILTQEEIKELEQLKDPNALQEKMLTTMQRQYRSCLELFDKDTMDEDYKNLLTTNFAIFSPGKNAKKSIVVDGSIFKSSENPLLMLKLIQWMHLRDINFEILYSYECHQVAEYCNDVSKSIKPNVLNTGLHSYQKLIDQGVISKEEHCHMTDCFYDHIALIQYELKRTGKSTFDAELYTNKTIDHEIVDATIGIFREYFTELYRKKMITTKDMDDMISNLPFSPKDAKSLSDVIETINGAYRCILKENKLLTQLNDLIKDKDRKIAIVKQINKALLSLPHTKGILCKHGECQLERFQKKQSCVDPASLLYALEYKPKIFFDKVNELLTTLNLIETENPQFKNTISALRTTILSINPFYFIANGKTIIKGDFYNSIQKRQEEGKKAQAKLKKQDASDLNIKFISEQQVKMEKAARDAAMAERRKAIEDEIKTLKEKANVKFSSEDSFDVFYNKLTDAILAKLKLTQSKLYDLCPPAKNHPFYDELNKVFQETKNNSHLDNKEKLLILFDALTIEKNKLNIPEFLKSYSFAQGNPREAIEFGLFELANPTYSLSEDELFEINAGLMNLDLHRSGQDIELSNISSMLRTSNNKQ